MNFPLKSKPKRSYVKPVALGVVCVVLAAALYFFPTGVRQMFYTLARPVWIAGDAVGGSGTGIGNFFRFKKNLIQQNQMLLEQITALELKETDYDNLVRENAELKSLLGRPESAHRTLARVLSKPPRSPYDSIVIDVGSDDGVVRGSKVYLAGNVIIGQITDVTPRTSLVSMFSSGSAKEDAVLERTGATFQLSGSGSANFVLEVPKDTDILWGDTFVYPALSQGVMASIYYVESNPQSSFKKVYARIPGSVFQAQWVFVEKNMI